MSIIGKALESKAGMEDVHRGMHGPSCDTVFATVFAKDAV